MARKVADAPEVDSLSRVGLAPPAEPEFLRHGDECALCWPAVRVVMTFSSLRESREGPVGELVVDVRGAEIHWGRLSLASTAARDTLAKTLDREEPTVPWRPMLERACRLTALALRRGEPLVTLTGTVTSPSHVLLPGMLYEGNPTLLYADGDTGKSLVALTLAVAAQSGTALPHGLRPARAVTVAYLDWETDQDTLEARLALIARGLGIAPPPILYKRMTRPLIHDARELAAEFSRRHVEFIIVDSMMFAVASGDGAAFHEPITAFYGALRLFAPAAPIVLNHITNADARSGSPARPFGGAFAFNGPRLIWEARRDQEIHDATAIVFTCKKANNLPRKPDPFGLKFQPGDGTITVHAFDVAEASPHAVASVSLFQRLKVSLAHGAKTVDTLAEELEVDPGSIRTAFSRSGETFTAIPDTKPKMWGLAAHQEAHH